MRGIETSRTPGPSDSNEVTGERLERAIKATARCMVDHDLPQLLPTLKRLEAERDRLMKLGRRDCLRQEAVSGLNRNRPILHKLAPFFQHVTTSIRHFDFASDIMRECHFQKFARIASNLGTPIPETGAES